jgi:hypothetical protein
LRDVLESPVIGKITGTEMIVKVNDRQSLGVIVIETPRGFGLQ